MQFARRNQNGVTGGNGGVTVRRARQAFSGQDVHALFKVYMSVRVAGRFTRRGDRDFHKPERHFSRADRGRNDF